MSERVFSPQPVTQYNPITGEVRKESEKAAVVKKNFVLNKSKVAAVVSEKSTVINESVVKSIEKSTVVKDMYVMSKVGISNVLAVVSEKSVVDDNPKVSKVSDESNKSAVVAPVIDNKSVKASSVVADKPSSVDGDKVDVVKDKVDVVADKASDALKNKLNGKGKKLVVG
nr:hypothetical protein [Tanacetum cinerariifolium]